MICSQNTAKNLENEKEISFVQKGLNIQKKKKNPSGFLLQQFLFFENLLYNILLLIFILGINKMVHCEIIKDFMLEKINYRPVSNFHCLVIFVCQKNLNLYLTFS